MHKSALLLVLLSLTGCGSTPSAAEAVIRDRIASLDQFSDAIESGDAGRVRDAVARLKAVKAEFDTLDRASAEVKGLVGKYRDSMSRASKRLVETHNQAKAAGKLTPEMLKDLPDLGAI